MYWVYACVSNARRGPRAPRTCLSGTKWLASNNFTLPAEIRTRVHVTLPRMIAESRDVYRAHPPTSTTFPRAPLVTWPFRSCWKPRGRMEGEKKKYEKNRSSENTVVAMGQTNLILLSIEFSIKIHTYWHTLFLNHNVFRYFNSCTTKYRL